MSDKVQINLRVERKVADRLKAFAEIQDSTMSKIVEDALTDALAEKQADPEFQSKAEQWAQRQRDLLGAVVDPEGDQ